MEVSETGGDYKSRNMFLSGVLAIGSPVGAACKDLPPRLLAIEWRAMDWFSWHCPKTLQLVLNLQISHTVRTSIMPSIRDGKFIVLILKYNMPNWVLLYELPILDEFC